MFSKKWALISVLSLVAVPLVVGIVFGVYSGLNKPDSLPQGLETANPNNEQASREQKPEEIPATQIIPKDATESEHFILDLSLEHQAMLLNSGKWLEQLDRYYETLSDLVGGVPYGGEKNVILETDEYAQYWAIAGNPIKWSPNGIPNALYQVNNGDWLFGILHEIGHNFDSVHSDGQDGYFWTWDAEMSANWKMVYGMDVIPEMIVWQGGNKYSSSSLHPHIKEYYRSKAIESGELETVNIQGSAELAGGHGDPQTFHLLELKDRIGWEPFKKTYREMREMPRNSIPSDALARFELFVDILTQNTDTSTANPKEFLRDRGFPI
ncbi:MAG: hypothetical protein WD712_00775 [Candidatus Spechtbacterales bacterium]